MVLGSFIVFAMGQKVRGRSARIILNGSPVLVGTLTSATCEDTGDVQNSNKS